MSFGWALLVPTVVSSTLIRASIAWRRFMWSWCRLLIVTGICLNFCSAADDLPWSDEWSMTLQGVERWFIDYKDKSYLQVEPADLDDLKFLISKDVMIQTKFRQLSGTTVQFYSFPTLIIGTDTESWSTIIDGDNVYILGKVSKIYGDRLKFKTKEVMRAPSDANLIASKLADINEKDFTARIKFSQWVRKNSNVMGNRAVWISAADNIVSDCIDAIAKKSKIKHDVNLLLKAMNWATDELGDTSRAAELGSQEWINELNEVNSSLIIKRMSILGLIKYDGKWVTKREEKVLNFNRKLRGIKQNDDKAFFALAKYIAQYRDVLPESLELQHKALQTGLRHNPNSNLLRAALGRQSVEDEIEEKGLMSDFKDELTGLVITVPETWQRSKEAIDGDVTWIDPKSDTAYISLTVIRGVQSDTFLENFDKQFNRLKGKQGFVENMVEALGIGSASREARFSFLEGREKRQGILSSVLFIQSNTAYTVFCSYIENEATGLDTAYKHILNSFDSIKNSGDLNDTPKNDTKEDTDLKDKEQDAGTAAPEANIQKPPIAAPAPGKDVLEDNDHNGPR